MKLSAMEMFFQSSSEILPEEFQFSESLSSSIVKVIFSYEYLETSVGFSNAKLILSLLPNVKSIGYQVVENEGKDGNINGFLELIH
jgi:hypothetical protein